MIIKPFSEEPMTTQRRELYSSSNGDSWYLCRETNGHVLVCHEPNAASGGKASQVDVGTFLTKGGQGPEHQALLKLIGSLVEPNYRRYKPAPRGKARQASR
jgi:hypothetical protein